MTTPSTKHTPGPWTWDEPSNWHGLATRVYHENEKAYEPIARVQLSGWPRRVGLANACLIAAAPDLLAACRKALPQLRWANCHGSRCDELIAEIEAAIAKAEGK